MRPRNFPLYPPPEWVDAAKGAVTYYGFRTYLSDVAPTSSDGNVGDVWIDPGGQVYRKDDDTTWTLDANFAPKANAQLTGTVTAPTAAPGTDNTVIATTEFVTDAIAAAGSSSGLSAGKAYAVARGFFIQ